jgi:acyl carrier protein
MESLESQVPVDAATEAQGAISPTLAAMRAVLEEHFGIEAASVTPDRRLDTLGLDSLSFVEYAFELEKRLGIVLPDLPRDLATVGDLAQVVQAQVDAQGQSQPTG